MNIHLDNFEGPLDLLLHLVKSYQMDIYEIQISKIIEEYLIIIEKMQNLNIDVASSYLVMAAELLHLKSKSLLNLNDEDETDEYEFETEEDLRNKLIEYQKYKEVVDDFRLLKEKRDEVYTKDPSNISEYKDNSMVKNTDLTLEDLINAFLEFKKREEFLRPVDTKITKKELSISKRTEQIHKILEKRGKVSFVDLFETYTKDYVVVTFLSILNMSKNAEIVLTQEKNFSDIIIEKRV